MNQPTNTPQLTADDLSTLIDAIDACGLYPRLSKMVAGILIGSVVFQETHNEGAANAVARSVINEDDPEDRTLWEEKGTLLKAKLILLRDAIAIRDLAQDLENKNSEGEA